MTKWISTKTYNQIGPVAYRQWRAESHCCRIHGYALSFHFEFECDTLDARNWCVDYGGLRPLKDLLESWFDHTCLVAADDPEYDTFKELHKKGLIKLVEVERTGCEGLADFIYRYINDPHDGFLKNLGYGDRVWCCKVCVRETDANMAMRVGHRDEWDIVSDYEPSS